LLDEFKDVLAAIAVWSAAGFPVASDAELQRRRDICSACPDWHPAARCFFGRCLGECGQCGCTRLKWWLQTSRCKVGKW
jgi:hypothetical protein